LAIGALVQEALKAAQQLAEEGVTCEVVNMRFVKPVDGILLEQIASRFSTIITLEDNVITGGFGTAVAEYYSAHGISNIKLKNHGIPDRFIDHGTPAELYAELQLDAKGIHSVVKDFLGSGTRAGHASIRIMAT
jgi:1-deoxy-D-xylulose-5-phosphate synthase